MLQPGRESDLPLEPLGAQRVGELRVKHLERDWAIVAEVVGEVPRGHPPAAQLAVDEVAVSQCGSEPGQQVCQKTGPEVGEPETWRPIRARDRGKGRGTEIPLVALGTGSWDAGDPFPLPNRRQSRPERSEGAGDRGL